MHFAILLYADMLVLVTPNTEESLRDILSATCTLVGPDEMIKVHNWLLMQHWKDLKGRRAQQ